MTLLESLIALVILGLVATGFLNLFQETSRSARAATEWVEVISYAESAMEGTKVGSVPGYAPERATVNARPWPGAAQVDRITVTVALPGGGSFVLERLAPAR